jgi:predicted phosphatase
MVNSRIKTGTPRINSIYALEKLFIKVFLLIRPTPAISPMISAIKKEVIVQRNVMPKPGSINFVAAKYSLLPVFWSTLKKIE